MNDRDEITAYLAKIAEGRGIAPTVLGPEVPLLETGVLDSLSLLDFIRFVEKRWSLSVAEEDIVLENFGTIDAVARYLERRAATGVRV